VVGVERKVKKASFGWALAVEILQLPFLPEHIKIFGIYEKYI